MSRFVTGCELYDLIQQKSSLAKDILWVCSPCLGVGAHQIFSQNIVKSPPGDIRFVFRVDEVSVKSGDVDPYEVQYMVEHFKNVKTNDFFDCKIYAFDDSAIVCSANLTMAAFESNFEAGVLLEQQEAEKVKEFFTSTLWNKATTIRSLEKYKKLWNCLQPSARDRYGKLKHTLIKKWTDEGVSTWYFNAPFYFSKKTVHKIIKQTNLPKDLGVLGDIHISAFRNLKLGDLVVTTDFNKKRGLIKVELGRVFDKCKLETDDGDYHFVYEILKTYKVDRNKLITTLSALKIYKKTDIKLGDEQFQAILNTITRRRREAKQK